MIFFLKNTIVYEFQKDTVIIYEFALGIKTLILMWLSQIHIIKLMQFHTPFLR